ncbi:hypothetical protein ACS0TY_022895 [Phlomoides rotata]
MKALGEDGFPVPNAVDCNRHCIVMSLIQCYPLLLMKLKRKIGDLILMKPKMKTLLLIRSMMQA